MLNRIVAVEVCDARDDHSSFVADAIIIHTKNQTMQELIDRVTQEAGVTPEQAKKSIEAIAGFVKEKFPMMAGAVDQLFMTGNS